AICGAGDEEGRYQVELPRPGQRVWYLNLKHPRVPHWLWVNEVMFTEFGVRVPFTSFQQRLLNRCHVALSQLHSNAWSVIRCFELVTEFSELLQDPKDLLLVEESFHEFKGRYFKIFPIGDHPPFWLTLEGDARRLPPYWSFEAGFNYTPVTYKKHNIDQRNTAGILLWLFSKRHFKPKAVLGNYDRARSSSPGYHAIQSSSSRDAESVGRLGFLIHLGGGSSTNVGGGLDTQVEISSPIREGEPVTEVEIPLLQENVQSRKRLQIQREPGRRRVRCGTSAPWIDLLMPRVSSKSVEPRLTLADQWEGRCAKLTGDLKFLSQQKAEAEKERLVAGQARSKAEEDLKSVVANFKLLEKEKDVEIECLKGREVELSSKVEDLRKLSTNEKVRADKAEVALAESEEGR
ncbi:hypothetical protein PIB30_060021, partial [Stylosanthes scabra]|nr:hypothetical protein [Stylosanthes scabra]